MERLRSTRLSPIPAQGSASNVFPTVLEEEPHTPESDTKVSVGESPTEPPPPPAGHLFRKPRRRLPLPQPNISKNSRSSRSFDSGISCLLQSTTGNGEPGSPGGPPPNTDPMGSPNHISSRQSSYMSSSSPCNSPGPRSPRLPPNLSLRNPLSPRPIGSHNSSGGGAGFFGPSFNNSSMSRRFSEQIDNLSYPNSNKSSEVDSEDSSPPTEPSPPPIAGGSPPPTSPILRVSRRMLPETPKTPYNVWQQSRDSLDSGVYSRSTTCDSYPGCRNSGSPILSSTSPPTLARHSWRRGVARLPEPPVNSQNSGSVGIWPRAPADILLLFFGGR